MTRRRSVAHLLSAVRATPVRQDLLAHSDGIPAAILAVSDLAATLQGAT